MSLGIGAMLSVLTDNSGSVAAYNAALNQKITGLKVDDNEVIFDFENGTKLRLSDEGQSCCEHRYLSTDDKPEDFIGATLLGIDLESVDAPDEEDSYEVHEQTFMKINTSAGTLTVVAHNEHNGYYGGIAIKASA